MSFREYIYIRRVCDNPAGDFVKDARRDTTMPDVRTWPELRRYLLSVGACLAAIEAARTVWASYLRAH